MSASSAQHDEQEAIDQEASMWLIRIEEDGLDPQGECDFRRWLLADPRHRSTYDTMRKTWSDIAQVPGIADLVTMAEAAAPLPPARPARRWAAGAGIMVSLAAALLLMLYLISPNAPQYGTGIAETRIITLPDGSSVTLGAHSSITVDYKGAERRVILSSGEALFDVIHDARRPFIVDAGMTQVRDLGTAFDVNRASGSVRIGVIEGKVQVSGIAGTNRPPITVSGGEGVQLLQVNGAAGMSPASVLVRSPEAAGAWRDGRLVFDNVRLADLSADVNRYYAPGITLASPAVGELRVTAAFKTSEIPAFMSALDATLPVRTERSSDGAFRIIAVHP
jgi:transmembrane sensor